MPGIQLVFLVAICFVTSGVSVVTGSTSVITVPAMFQLGIDARVAVATNMFALTCMSFGGSLPFLKTSMQKKRRLPLLIVLTLIGSAMGAMFLLMIPSKVVPVIVSIAIIGVAVFSMAYRHSGVDPTPPFPTRGLAITGYALTFVLGIYGGLFSGGYVTILTAIFVATFRMTFIEAIATTKLINIFSSGIATVIFMRRGLVDYRLGAILGLTMFAGALLGGRYARRLSNLWLRRIYLTALWLLGLKTLLFDVLGHHDNSVANPPPA
jgi:uncharacterized membrane protein YfcA